MEWIPPAKASDDPFHLFFDLIKACSYHPPETEHGCMK
jgi:hypothetical protein